VPIVIAFLDCDGTLTKVKSSWEYLHRRLGLWENNADSYQKLFREGEIDYYEFCKRDALLWKGLPVSKVMDVMAEIPYQEGAEETIGSLRGMGITTTIVSTGLSLLVDKVKRDLGAHIAIANDLLTKNGHLTGDIRINVEYNKKGQLVEKILDNMKIKREEACAVGDGEGDTGMFEAVGLSIGFNPHPHILPLLGNALYTASLFNITEIIRNYG
jgi:phosphoserine phosphatase